MTQPLTPETLACGVDFLIARDPALARIQARLGNPPLWEREPGFPTLVYIILIKRPNRPGADFRAGG